MNCSRFRSAGLMLVGVLLMVSLVACAGPGPRQRQAAALERHMMFAGEPVESFYLRLMQEWQPLGETHVVVYTALNEAWLLALDQPCSGLDFAQAIQLTSTGSRVFNRFDSVRFDQQFCRIQEIRPIDVRAMKEARRSEPGSESTG
jgi:hypothetical protein